MGNPGNPGVDLVVTNYRTPEDLRNFCWSVFMLPPSIPWTLTVVNVSPTPEDLVVGDQVAGWGDNIIHLSYEENIGYGRACNAGAFATFGCERCKPVLALFNADVVLSKGAVDECVHALLDHPDWGVLGPRQVDDQGLLTHAGIFGTREQPRHRAWKQPDSSVFADVQPAVTVSGAAYFIKRALWNQLTQCELYRQVTNAEGAFLPTPHYYEETFCSYHAIEHGSQVIYYGPVCVVHRWHRASPERGWADQQMAVSQALFRYACDLHGIVHD